MVGTLVGVRSGVDGHFYRGLLTLPINDMEAQVTMVDYGNREEVHCSQMRPLSEKLAQVRQLNLLSWFAFYLCIFISDLFIHLL
jgi:hypothetical protein